GAGASDPARAVGLDGEHRAAEAELSSGAAQRHSRQAVRGAVGDGDLCRRGPYGIPRRGLDGGRHARQSCCHAGGRQGRRPLPPDLSISDLARMVGVPVERLLEQIKEAGLPQSSATETISNEQRAALLAFLKSRHGDSSGGDTAPRKITLKRKT